MLGDFYGWWVPPIFFWLILIFFLLRKACKKRAIQAILREPKKCEKWFHFVWLYKNTTQSDTTHHLSPINISNWFESLRSQVYVIMGMDVTETTVCSDIMILKTKILKIKSRRTVMSLMMLRKMMNKI